MLYQAPSPQRKKEPAPRENKLRLFLKRSSEPLLNLQNAAQQVKQILSQLNESKRMLSVETLINLKHDVINGLHNYYYELLKVDCYHRVREMVLYISVVASRFHNVDSFASRVYSTGTV